MSSRGSFSSEGSGGFHHRHHSTSSENESFLGNSVLLDSFAYFDIGGIRHNLPNLEVELDSAWMRLTHLIDVIYPNGQHSRTRLVYDTMTYFRADDDAKVFFYFYFISRFNFNSSGCCSLR